VEVEVVALEVEVSANNFNIQFQSLQLITVGVLLCCCTV
jgi:hypothetical protein